MKISWYNKVLPAVGLALVLLACAVPPAAADAVLPQLGADLAATPLDDAALDSQRAAGILGFLSGFPQTLLRTLPPVNLVGANILPDGQHAAGILGFLRNLLVTLPPVNLVVAHVNDTRIQQGPSPLPVEINASVGGTTVRLFAGSGVSASHVSSRTR
jgi:hypothetical protein